MSRAGRRAHGEGAVYEQRPGLYAAAVDLGWVDGKRRRKYVYGKTQEDVIRKRDEVKRKLRVGVDLTAKTRTVSQWLDEWMADFKETDGTRASTLRRYREVIKTHLKPGLGNVKLEKLDARQVQRFLAARRTTHAPASLIKIHGVLRAALADAERMDLIERNVAKAVRPAKLAQSERRALTPEEASRFFGVIEDDRLEGLFVLAVATGLRRGELLGLRWEDLDLAERLVRVRRSLLRVNGQLTFEQTKTARSKRAVPIAKFAVPVMERHRRRQVAERLKAGTRWQDGQLVFASTIGTPMEPRNVNRSFERLRAAAGLDWLHLHDLRHAFATFLLDQGVELRVVMELLGHSTIRLTADTYGHVLSERAREASDAIDSLFGDAS